MKLRTLLAACVAVSSLSFAGAAFAETPITVKLASPLAAPTKIVAGGAVFVCAGDTCTATPATPQTFSTATCKTLAKNVGVVASFNSNKSFDDARLSTCNAVAATTQMATR